MCQTDRVYDPPVTVFNDVFHPQIVEVVHQVNVVTRHHCVPCEKHIFEISFQDEGGPQGGDSNESEGISSISKTKSRKKRRKERKHVSR